MESREKIALIDKEKGRLSKNFAKISGKKKAVIKGLIERAAFMRVSLDNLELDLNEKGFVEQFSQGDQEPYDRKRPVADLYNTMNANYQKIIKQLTDLLPKESEIQSDDGFDGFVSERDD